MSDTNETEIEAPSAEQAARQVDETSLEQTVQIEQRRSERPRMLTEKGK